MNFGLARELYGLTPWCVDQHTLPGLLSVLNNHSNGITLEVPALQYNTPFLYTPSSETKFIQWENELKDSNFTQGIGLIVIDGPITVNGGASSIGMRQLSDTMLRMNEDHRVIGFIVYADSGGGASSAVKIMVDVINTIKKVKPVEGVIKKGGLAASACYGILSACTKIYAESPDSIVGSCGTMIQFDGKAANTTAKDTGTKHIRLYATKSTKKNEGFEAALNHDNYDVIINEMLDPTNDRFLKMLLKNRPSLKKSAFDDGHTEFAENAIGTFIDGIQSLEATAQGIINMGNSSKNPDTQSLTKTTLISNFKIMTIEELQQNHPVLYTSIFNSGIAQGVKSEADRVGSWMAYANTDIATVMQGIKSGKSIGQTQREELLIKKSSLSHVNNLESDSPPDISPDESKSKTEDTSEATTFYTTVKSNLSPIGH